MSWQRMPVALRAVIVFVGLALAVNLGIGILDRATTGADRRGEDSDPRSTAPNGTAAWVELLRRNGLAIERTRALPSSPDPDSTIVLLDAALVDDDIEVLREFVDAGGRLVIGGRASEDVLGALMADPPVWTPVGTSRAAPVARAPQVDELRAAGISTVVAAGDGAWRELGATTPLLEGSDTVIASAGRDGADLVAVADPSVVQNRFLAEADNAAFSLALAGGRAVTFVDPRLDEASGIAAIPLRWRLALAGLVLAFLVGAVAVGRRIGPPDRPGREHQPPRRTYVDAVGLALERTRRPDEALVGLQRHVRAGLGRRSGLGAEATDDELRAAGTRLGWPPEEIEAVLHPASGATMLDVGRALARLTASESPRARAPEGADA